MASLDTLFNLTVNKTTQTISKASFSVPLILGPNVNVAERKTVYTSLSSIAAVLIGGTDAPEYKAAQKFFLQSPHVTTLALGYQIGTRTLTDNAGTFTAGSVAVTINGTTYTQAFDTDKNTSLTALAAQIAAHANVDTAVYNSGAHTIVITPNTGLLLAVSSSTALVTGTMTFVLTATKTEDPEDSLAAIRLYNDEWYAFVVTSRDETDVLNVATWAEANTKFFATASADAEILSTSLSGDTGSIAKVFKTNGFEHSFVMYHGSAATDYPDAAVLGKIVTLDPGTYTLMYKDLIGVTASDLTDSQIANALEKNVLLYNNYGGTPVLLEGKVPGDEFIDTIIYIDYLVSTLKTALFAGFRSVAKFSFEDDDIQAIRSLLEPALSAGVTAKAIKKFAYDSNDEQIGGYYFTFPKQEDISAEDLANRELTGCSVTIFLAGAIHKVELTLNIGL